jgi:hypothetical protein
MSDQGREISFVSPIMAMIDDFLANYEELKGPLRNDLERGLIISYVLGVMRCDVDAIWDSLGRSPLFGALHPRTVFEDCVEKDETVLAARRDLINEELRKRGWVPLDR